MKKPMLTAAALSLLLLGSCTKNASVGPDQPSMANARTGSDAQGVLAPISPLPTSTLPTGVKTYLDQKYAGYSLLKVDRQRVPGTATITGTKVRFLQNGTLFDLDFDASNAVVAKPAGPTPPPPPTGDHSVRYVLRNDLPAAVASVVTSSTYASYTYGWAELHTHDGATQYDVTLFSNNQPTVLHLSASGAIVTPMPPTPPVAGTVTAPGSGTAAKPAGPMSGTATAPKPPVPGGPVSGTATAPKPPVPVGPMSGTATPPARANQQFILDASKLPSAVQSYLQTNFGGYVFLAAELSTPPAGSTSEYRVDIAVGKQLYKLAFTATGDLLMAEARN